VNSADISEDLQRQVEHAVQNKQKLNIVAGGSKTFLGVVADAPTLEVSGHYGIINYEPTELVITARAGTPLSVINDALQQHGQALAFEPPTFSNQATIGGTIACAMAGPAQPYLGGVRDHILGCTIVNGHGQRLRFGGEVMKNVAGYDVSRLMTGSMGTLGLLLDVSIKVLPKPRLTATIATPCNTADAIDQMQQLAGLGLPITASAYFDNTLYIRLSGTEPVLNAAKQQLISSDSTDATESLWQQLREQQLPFFLSDLPLWRISVPGLTPAIDFSGNNGKDNCLYDWAGTQRWLLTDAASDSVRNAAQAHGGHATLYRADDSVKKDVGVFQPLTAPLMKLHKRLKSEFDPHGLFNYQRLYPEF